MGPASNLASATVRGVLQKYVRSRHFLAQNLPVVPHVTQNTSQSSHHVPQRLNSSDISSSVWARPPPAYSFPASLLSRPFDHPSLLCLRALVLLQAPSLISSSSLFLSTYKLLLLSNFLIHPVYCPSSLLECKLHLDCCCSLLDAQYLEQCLEQSG